MLWYSQVMNRRHVAQALIPNPAVHPTKVDATGRMGLCTNSRRPYERIGDAAHWVELSDRIHANPETNFKEFKASGWLADELRTLGFEVETGVGGIATAFRATLDSGTPGPSVGFIMEYDALEGMGHACGHNTKGPATLCGIETFRKNCGRFRGRIVVFGCPAEEGGGGKVIMAAAGVFDSVDLCLEPTVSSDFTTGVRRLAVQPLSITFTGKTAHAALKEAKGINALDALLFVWNGLEYLRRVLGERGVIHGVIAEGGTVPAAVPDRAVTRLHVRATDVATVREYVSHIEDLSQLAARMSGAGVMVEKGLAYLDYIKCPTLTGLVIRNFEELGISPRVLLGEEPRGASDTANVSHIVPCETMAMSLGKGLLPHTTEYCLAAGGEPGHQAVRTGGKMVAACLVDLLVGDNDELLAKIKDEFRFAKGPAQ